MLVRSIVFYGLNTFIPLYWIAALHQSKAAGGFALTLLLVVGGMGAAIRAVVPRPGHSEARAAS